jgi:hypothetical protein
MEKRRWAKPRPHGDGGGVSERSGVAVRGLAQGGAWRAGTATLPQRPGRFPSPWYVELGAERVHRAVASYTDIIGFDVCDGRRA